LTTYGHSPSSSPGPAENAGPGGKLRTDLPAHGLQFGLIRDHASREADAAVQVAIKLALVSSGLWRNIASALNALSAGLGVDFSYRPDSSIPAPAFQILMGVGALREGLAAGARGLSRITGRHERAAFRIDGYLQDRRHPNYDDAGDAGKERTTG
jgi:hypothetical protein